MPHVQTFTIQGWLPGYNEYLKAKGAVRGHERYNDLRKSTMELVALYARQGRVVPCPYPVVVSIAWVEPNAKRDLDNIQAGVKEILDALRAIGVLRNDGQRDVQGIVHTVAVNRKAPAIHVTLTQCGEPTS